jgi:hypothetical protein
MKSCAQYMRKGKLRKGYRFKKGGGVVKAKAKRRKR